MISKLFAAAIFQNQTILANGETNNILERILENEKLGTRFNIEQTNKDQFIHNYIKEQHLGTDLETYLLTHNS